MVLAVCTQGLVLDRHFYHLSYASSPQILICIYLWLWNSAFRTLLYRNSHKFVEYIYFKVSTNLNGIKLGTKPLIHERLRDIPVSSYSISLLRWTGSFPSQNTKSIQSMPRSPKILTVAAVLKSLSPESSLILNTN